MSICNFLTDDNWYNYKGEKKYNLEIENIGLAFKTLNFAVGDVINYSIYLKKKFNCKIDVNIFMTFIDFMNFIDYFYDQINDGIKIDSKKRNYF